MRLDALGGIRIRLRRSDVRFGDRPHDLPQNVLLLVIVNASEAGTTVNLMAPIVVNATTGVCAQLILDDQGWPLKAELSARSA